MIPNVVLGIPEGYQRNDEEYSEEFLKDLLRVYGAEVVLNFEKVSHHQM